MCREASFGRLIAVAVRICPADDAIDAEPDLLLQAVLNLLKNAAEAGAGQVTLLVERSAGRVSVAVEDDGPGIADDALADMFLPFFTSKLTDTGSVFPSLGRLRWHMVM